MVTHALNSDVITIHCDPSYWCDHLQTNDICFRNHKPVNRLWHHVAAGGREGEGRGRVRVTTDAGAAAEAAAAAASSHSRAQVSTQGDHVHGHSSLTRCRAQVRVVRTCTQMERPTRVPVASTVNGFVHVTDRHIVAREDRLVVGAVLCIRACTYRAFNEARRSPVGRL